MTLFDWLSKLADDINQAVLESVNSLITGIFGRLPFLLAGIIVLLIFWLAARLIRYLFLASTRRARFDSRLRILISRIIVVAVVMLGVFASITIIVPTFNLGSLIAGLGFSSFVIGFATKDILNNFLSGVLILWQQPFHIGDYLFVGSNQGKVEYIGVRATSLRKDDGELILIPNGDMYSSALTIRGAGAQRRMNLKFSVAYDEKIDLAKDRTYAAVTEVDGVVTDPKPHVLVSDLASDGVSITVNFWINTNESKPLEVYDRVAIRIVKALKDAQIEVYPPGAAAVKPADPSSGNVKSKTD